MSKMSAVSRYKHLQEWLAATGRTRKAKPARKPEYTTQRPGSSSDED